MWIVGILILIGVLVFVASQIFSPSSSQDNAIAAVNEMCKIPPGTPIEALIPKAKSLGFKAAAKGTVMREIEVFHAEEPAKSIEWTDDQLPGLSSGRIIFGKMVAVPFLRHFCEITFQDRRVTSTRQIVLD